jgi:hypothetical protein
MGHHGMNRHEENRKRAHLDPCISPQPHNFEIEKCFQHLMIFTYLYFFFTSQRLEVFYLFGGGYMVSPSQADQDQLD